MGFQHLDPLSAVHYLHHTLSLLVNFCLQSLMHAVCLRRVLQCVSNTSYQCMRDQNAKQRLIFIFGYFNLYEMRRVDRRRMLYRGNLKGNSSGFVLCTPGVHFWNPIEGLLTFIGFLKKIKPPGASTSSPWAS